MKDKRAKMKDGAFGKEIMLRLGVGIGCKSMV